MVIEIKPSNNAVIKDAVRKFHNTVTAEGHFAITTVWSINDETARHSNFTSGLIGKESFSNGIAGAIHVAAQEYGINSEKFAADIAEDVKLYAEGCDYEDSEALANLKCLIDCYNRFRRDNIPRNKTFYSDFEETLYNNWYTTVCERYEKVIGEASIKLREEK